MIGYGHDSLGLLAAYARKHHRRYGDSAFVSEVTSSRDPTASQSAAVGAPTGGGGYDAFISYSHAADGLLAPGLQSALQSIGKPWYRRRALRVFRDVTSLSASPELWPTIERALERSQYFVLLTSPDSAASAWVEQEVAWWRAHRASDTLLIVLTDGDLWWDDDADDFSASSVVPLSARGWLGAEPLWVDLRWASDEEHVSAGDPRFRDAAASLAAPIRGIDKDELVGEDVREHQRTVRLARAAVAILGVLTIAAIAGGLLADAQRRVADTQRRQAQHEAREATSLALTSAASPLLRDRPDISLLLALEGYRASPRPEARSTLLRALIVARDPGVRAILHGHTEAIEDVASTPDGRMLATASDDNTIRLWDTRSRKPLGELTGHQRRVRAHD